MTGGSNSGGVAIVGIACRFRGAADHGGFWRNLRGKVESITALTDDELIAARAVESLRDPSYVERTPLLPDFDLFDAATSSSIRHRARLMDPQQRLFSNSDGKRSRMQVTVGETPGPVGVYVATGGVVALFGQPAVVFLELPGYTAASRTSATSKDFPRYPYFVQIKFNGSKHQRSNGLLKLLVAAHLACQAIVAGECDMALAKPRRVRTSSTRRSYEREGGSLAGWTLPSV